MRQGAGRRREGDSKGREGEGTVQEGKGKRRVERRKDIETSRGKTMGMKETRDKKSTKQKEEEKMVGNERNE